MLYIFLVILHRLAIFLILESRHRRYYIEILGSELQLHNICKDKKSVSYNKIYSIKEMLFLIKYLIHKILHTAFD